MASRGFSCLLALEITASRHRPCVSAEVRVLIRAMSMTNPLWGAPRVHGGLLKLGIDVRQTTVAKYMTSCSSLLVNKQRLLQSQKMIWMRLAGCVPGIR